METNHYQKFIDLIDDYVVLSGEAAVEKLNQLCDRIGFDRHKTLNRLIEGAVKFGCKIEFVSKGDSEEEGFEFYADFYSKENEGCSGCFTEGDSWISIDLDSMKTWKRFEEVFAHETMHLLQSIVYQGERVPERSNMALAYPAIFESCDEIAYSSWIDMNCGPDLPCFEVEAYSIQDRPKQVAFAIEWLHDYRQEVWSGKWSCPLP